MIEEKANRKNHNYFNITDAQQKKDREHVAKKKP